MEQHYYQLLRAARSPLRVTYRHARTRHTAQSVWVSPSSPSLVSGASGLQPCHCRSARPQQSVAGEEKSGILYVHIYLPAAGLLQLAGFPPALKSSSSLIPRQGQLGGWAEMACRGGDARWGDPTRPKGGKWHPSPPVRRQSLLEVSELSKQHVPQPRLPGIHLSPWRWGETVKLRPSVSQIQADALLQQFEANLALGFPG